VCVWGHGVGEVKGEIKDLDTETNIFVLSKTLNCKLVQNNLSWQLSLTFFLNHIFATGRKKTELG
jgi:hypothetical protein